MVRTSVREEYLLEQDAQHVRRIASTLRSEQEAMNIIHEILDDHENASAEMIGEEEFSDEHMIAERQKYLITFSKLNAVISKRLECAEFGPDRGIAFTTIPFIEEPNSMKIEKLVCRAVLPKQGRRG